MTTMSPNKGMMLWGKQLKVGSGTCTLTLAKRIHHQSSNRYPGKKYRAPATNTISIKEARRRKSRRRNRSRCGGKPSNNRHSRNSRRNPLGSNHPNSKHGTPSHNNRCSRRGSKGNSRSNSKRSRSRSGTSLAAVVVMLIKGILDSTSCRNPSSPNSPSRNPRTKTGVRLSRTPGTTTSACLRSSRSNASKSQLLSSQHHHHNRARARARTRARAKIGTGINRHSISQMTSSRPLRNQRRQSSRSRRKMGWILIQCFRDSIISRKVE